MARLLLLLLIAGAVVIFTLQNLSPIGLVFLGIRIQALPLAVWVVGSLIAGSFTTLLLSGFFSLSKASVRRSAQRVAAEKPRSPWSDSAAPTGSASTRTARTQNAGDFRPAGPGGSRRPVDDWEANQPDDWDDWNDSAAASNPAASRPRSAAASAAARTVIDDPVDRPRTEPNRSESRRSESARRTDFEAPQSPPAGQQSGSSYSYRYRDAQESATPRKSNEVYDAEYRVLIPPYTPDSNPVPPPPPPSAPSVNDDDDWGLDDDLEDKRTR